MIKPIKIEVQYIEHFDPEGNSLGFLNYCEHLELRIQIKKAKIRNYSLKYNNQIIDMDQEATLRECPKGLYDLTTDYLMQLIF